MKTTTGVENVQPEKRKPVRIVMGTQISLATRRSKQIQITSATNMSTTPKVKSLRRRKRWLRVTD